MRIDAPIVLEWLQVRSGLKKLDIEVPAEQMGALFNKFDLDGNFKLDPQEFYAMYRQLKERPASLLQPAQPAAAPPPLPAEVQEVYDSIFDKNGDGKLSVSEVHAGLKKLGAPVKPEEMSTLFNGFDTDSNFRLEPQEFYELYRKCKAQLAAQEAAAAEVAAAEAAAAEPAAAEPATAEPATAEPMAKEPATAEPMAAETAAAETAAAETA